MRVEVVRAPELTGCDYDRWRSIQSANPGLQSPFFAPEFAAAVSAERPDTFIAVIGQGGRIEGFFPFHRNQDRAGKPIGLRISDYHGVIAPDLLEYPGVELLRACGLGRWDFRCVPVSQKIFVPWQSTIMPTISIDISEGFDRYLARLEASGSRLPKRLERMRSQTEKQLGALRFTWHAANPAALRALLECKSDQYRRTSIPDLFDARWIANVLERLHGGQGVGCRGVLSELHAGGKLMAAHFGIRALTVLHYWFPCYLPSFARYSPGLMLLMEIARCAAAEGISRIDLGFANAAYKERFGDVTGEVARGSVTVPAEQDRL
jgi:CelD/BcsL family acetyltransferase involved in cellulose biosynthesis